MSDAPHVYLIDGSAYIWRAFHALGNQTRLSDGMPISAVKGFSEMLWKLLRVRIVGEAPSHIAVIFDHKRARSHRTDIYPQYKSNRSVPPDDIKHQFGLVRRAVRAFDIACIELSGFEADDIIATYARQAVDLGGTAVIVSGDKDFFQLVSDDIMIWDPWWVDRTLPEKERESGRVVGEAEVRKKFGVPPSKVCEVQALMGDTSDNIPGVKNIGAKIAAELIVEHGSLDRLFENVDLIPQTKRREWIREGEAAARMSLQLATLRQDLDLPTPFEELTYFPPDADSIARLLRFMNGLQLFQLGMRIADHAGVDINAYEADEELAEEGAGTGWKFRHE